MTNLFQHCPVCGARHQISIASAIALAVARARTRPITEPIRPINAAMLRQWTDDAICAAGNIASTNPRAFTLRELHTMREEAARRMQERGLTPPALPRTSEKPNA